MHQHKPLFELMSVQAHHVPMTYITGMAITDILYATRRATEGAGAR